MAIRKQGDKLVQKKDHADYYFKKGTNKYRKQMLVYLDPEQLLWMEKMKMRTNQPMQNVVRQALHFAMKSDFTPEVVIPAIMKRADLYRAQLAAKKKEYRERIKNGGRKQKS